MNMIEDEKEQGDQWGPRPPLLKLSEADLQSIYESYQHWIDDMEQERGDEDWWAGHGYGNGEFAFDINFVMDDPEDANDWAVVLYPVDSDGYLDTLTWTDVTDEFKAYLSKLMKKGG